MKKNMYWLALSAMLLVNANVQAQTLRLNPKTFNMTIAGTTNVHDFKMKVTLASGELVIANSKPQSMSVDIPVKGLKSDEKLMDTKTYQAFNADKFPMISFKMTETSAFQVNGSDIQVTAVGNMTMNGVSRRVTLKSTGKIIKPGVYEFSGTIALKMTDFKMIPPTAMMGMMKVGDAVTLRYKLTFEGTPIN